jgi:hypothetical protein
MAGSVKALVQSKKSFWSNMWQRHLSFSKINKPRLTAKACADHVLFLHTPVALFEVDSFAIESSTRPMHNFALQVAQAQVSAGVKAQVSMSVSKLLMAVPSKLLVGTQALRRTRRRKRMSRVQSICAESLHSYIATLDVQALGIVSIQKMLHIEETNRLDVASRISVAEGQAAETEQPLSQAQQDAARAHDAHNQQCQVSRYCVLSPLEKPRKWLGACCERGKCQAMCKLSQGEAITLLGFRSPI